jgi:hypothetical protein
MHFFNSALFTPRNFILIGVIAVMTHLVAAPIYKKIDGH